MSKVFELEGKILECLGKENEHEVESDLLELLNYDNFEFIKMIKVNWFIILYLTQLAKSENKQEER